jgi:cytochrome c oxidase assembly protein subunit 11
MSDAPSDLARKNRRALMLLSGLVAGMFAFGFALVPLYGLLCEITGIQSVEQRSQVAPAAETASGAAVAERYVTVKFDAAVHPELPWAVRPLERKLRVRVGEMNEVLFVAENRSSSAVIGQAISSVAPWQATGYLSKLECFCFRQQTLAGGEVKEMPLRFAISPELPAGMDSITLSYSVLRVADAPGEQAGAGPVASAN